MANLSDLYQLDPTGATSNSNYAGANIQEGCAPSGINNALRALGSMVARSLNYKSASLSTSVSTNIAAASTGLFMTLIGANAINSFGLVPGEHPEAAVVRLLHYESSASVSHGSNIILLGGASRKMQPGDIQGVIHDHATSDVWREWLFSSGDGRATYGDFTATSASASVLNTANLTASTASISTFNTVSISASVIRVAGVQVFPRATFRVTKGGSTQNSISATATPLTWSTEDWDVGGLFAANAWTPPAGKVRVSANVYFTNANAVDNELLTVYILKNGATELLNISQRGGTGPATTTITTIVDVNGTDTISVAAQKGGAGIGSVDGTTTLTYFAGEQI